jgi:ABC-2 type transport system ATP-binding protein
MTEPLIINVHNLNKSFGAKAAVQNVSLQVKRGEIYGFLGPNGSGKTTTIRMLCGLMQPDSGEGQCLGYDILSQSKLIKPLVGYVPQSFCLYKDLTVAENLTFIARANNEYDYAKRVVEIMDDLSLTPYKNTLAGSLSGGWKQQLSLAAALMHKPKLLLLDEPTAGVDPKSRREFWTYISHLTTQGITVLVSTHYMDEAERCNRLAYIVQGRLMIQGTIVDIMTQVGLSAWSAQGNDLAMLAAALEDKPGIEQVIPWGNALRICGTEPTLMQKTIAKYPNYSWEAVDASLEEVFIHLVYKRTENSQRGPLNEI